MAGTSLDIIDQPQAASGQATLEVTPAAWAQIPRFLREKGAESGAALRIGVRGGGCSGLEYVLVPDQNVRPTDIVIGHESGARVLVDPKSILFLQGSVFDYVAGLLDAGFRFVNPQAKTSCSCGSSFAV